MDNSATGGFQLFDVLADLRAKADGEAGRAAQTLFGGRDNRLRQTVIFMYAGHELAEHDSPGDAALQVLEGRVSLRWDSESVSLARGEVMHIPLRRHSLVAEEDAAVILTVALHSDWSDQG